MEKLYQCVLCCVMMGTVQDRLLLSGVSQNPRHHTLLL